MVDNSALENTTTMLFEVHGPAIPPTARFVVSAPNPLYPGVAAFFDGQDSSTPYGVITAYDWDFGDGTNGSGERVSHAYRTAGSYQVVLTVTNSWDVSGSATRQVEVFSVPTISLVMYSHPSGFRLPVPQDWDRTEDEQVQGSTVDLVLRGPTHDGFQTNILVEGISDSSVREDPASMQALVDSLLDELRSGSPGLFVTEAPSYRTVSGHAAAVFAVLYVNDPRGGTIVQKAAIVVSEAHGKVWLLLLSVRGAQFALYNGTFERMIDGFEITAAPPISLGVIAAIVIAAVVAVFAVILVVRRRRARKRALAPTAPPAGPRPFALGPAGGPTGCAGCGSPIAADDAFCMLCGRPAASTPAMSPSPRPK